jgi:serine/threonine-protein kinase RsbW
MVEKCFNILSDYTNVGEVNKNIKAFLSANGVEQHICHAVDICLTEAINNVIKHSYKNDFTRNVEIQVSKDSNFFEIVIIDDGLSRKNLEIPQLQFDPNDINNLPEGGMGLYIIRQLMDELKYETREGKNYFSLKKWLI